MKWQSCKLTKITQKQYEITWTDEGNTTTESLPINTLKLRPLNFDKDLASTNNQTEYARFKVAEGEQKLLDYRCHTFLNWNQLFEVDYNLHTMSEEELIKRWDEYQKRHLLKGRLNIAVEFGHASKLAKLFTLGPMVSQLKV